jgi:predicted hydrolase (HD superfamily)
MSSYLQAEKTSRIVAAAADLTSHILRGDPKRLTHSRAVARQAEFFTRTIDLDSGPLLVAAAWVHDIGYAPELRDTGFHPIDGARYLQSLGWSPAICNLVAHHSGARFVARVLKLDRELDAFLFRQDAVSDALTVADETAGPNGQAMTVEQRMSEMLRRHGSQSANARAHGPRQRYIRAAALRVAHRLERCGVDRTQQHIIAA